MQIFEQYKNLSNEINRINNVDQIKLKERIIKNLKERNLRYFKLNNKYCLLHNDNIYEILENNELYEINFIDYLPEIKNLDKHVEKEIIRFKNEFLNTYKEKFEEFKNLYEKCLKKIETINDNECLNLIKNLNFHYSYYKSRNQIYADYVIYTDKTYKSIGSDEEEINPKEYLKLFLKYNYKLLTNFIELLN